MSPDEKKYKNEEDRGRDGTSSPKRRKPGPGARFAQHSQYSEDEPGAPRGRAKDASGASRARGAPDSKKRASAGRDERPERPGRPGRKEGGRGQGGARRADDRFGGRRSDDRFGGRPKGGADKSASRFEGERRSPGEGGRKESRPDARRASKATFERAAEAYGRGQDEPKGKRPSFPQDESKGKRPSLRQDEPTSKRPSFRRDEPTGKRFPRPSGFSSFEERFDDSGLPVPELLEPPAPISGTPPRPLLPEPLSLGQAWTILDRYAEALRRVHPLRPKHQRMLPNSVRRMSELLTSERDRLEPGYLSEGALLAAYLHYFLPWNLVRMTRLLASLPIELADGATVVDLGCGPLTFMQALWIARPELRARKLSFVCVDRAPAAMRDGLKLFEELARLTGVETPPWRATMVHGGVTMPLRDRADLLVLANVLNELNWKGESLARQAEDLAETFLERLSPRGRLLLIEPGVRRSGRVLSHLRTGLLELGARVIAPCLHQAACPMLERRQPAWVSKMRKKSRKEGDDGKPGQYHSWCHFNFSSEGAPRWLTELTKAAELDKDNLSLSFLYAGRPASREEAGGKVGVRVVSESFKVLGRTRPLIGSYGCSDRGLLLLMREQGQPPLRSGERFAVSWPRTVQRDAKSGAVEILLTPSNKPRNSGDERRPPRPADSESGGLEPPRRRPSDHSDAPRRDESGRDESSRDGADRSEPGRSGSSCGEHGRGRPDRKGFDKKSSGRRADEPGKRSGQGRPTEKTEKRDERDGSRRPGGPARSGGREADRRPARSGGDRAGRTGRKRS